jgi:hypothetical protein
MKLTMLVSRLFKFFIPSTIEEIARKTGFMKRHSKLLPETFTKAITLGLLDAKNITEEVILQKCSLIQNGLQISKQAIKERLGQCGPFMKALLSASFEYVYQSLINC